MLYFYTFSYIRYTNTKTCQLKTFYIENLLAIILRMTSNIEPIQTLNEDSSKLHREKNKMSPVKNNDRFGGKSYNMFFLRHTAHPRNLRLISG